MIGGWKIVSFGAPTTFDVDASPGERWLAMPLAGPPGPQGPPGASGAGFVYTQATPLAVWTIPHNLGFRPAVEITTTGGIKVDASVTHLSLNTLQIEMVTPIAGFARCT